MYIQIKRLSDLEAIENDMDAEIEIYRVKTTMNGGHFFVQFLSRDSVQDQIDLMKTALSKG